MTSQRAVVLGLGNVLMGDDGLGPWVVQSLHCSWQIPDRVLVRDLGTPGFDLLPFLAGTRLAILVDTVRVDAPPGTVRTWDADALLAHAPTQRVSPHEPGVKQALLSLQFAGTGPEEVLLVGVVPESVSQGTGLSETLRAAACEVEARVVEALQAGGFALQARQPPLAFSPWWTRSPT